MSATSVPPVIDALVAAFNTIEGLYAHDGPEPEPKYDDYLQVAVGPNAIAGNNDHEPGLGLAQLERYTVACRLWSRRGDGEFSERRAAVDAFYGQVKALIDADKTVGGVCMWAQVGRPVSWTPAYAGAGRAYTLDFNIDVRARVA